MIHVKRLASSATYNKAQSVLIQSNAWIHRRIDILFTDRAKIAQGRNYVSQSVNKSLIYMRARVSWLDIDEQSRGTRKYRSLVLLQRRICRQTIWPMIIPAAAG